MSDVFRKINKETVDHIKYRNTIMTGEVTAVNNNGTYDVKIAQAGSAYPDVETLDYNANFSVGEIVDIAFEYGNRELPKIMGTAKKIAQEPSVVEVDYTSNLPNEPEPEPEPEPDIQLFENQPDTSIYYPGIKSSTTYFGQHFIVESNHTVERIDLLIGKYSAEQTGIAYIDLYNADSNGHPTGTVLTTATLDTSTLINIAGEYSGWENHWTEITLPEAISLISGNRMVIVIRFPDANSTHWVTWAQSVDALNPDPNGRGIYSTNSGATWQRLYATYPNYCDFTFKIYGRLN